MKSKALRKPFNPFRAGAGILPPHMAGREAETKLLAKVIGRLCGGREKRRGPLASVPFPPIKIVGPRGVGKTALLTWVERQAEERGVRCVYCDSFVSMRELLADISPFQRLLYFLKRGHMRPYFKDVARGVVRRKPLLLLLDEVQRYDPALLRAVLQGSQSLIDDGYPLGLVMAGKPGLDGHLNKAEVPFIGCSKHLYINTLSDAATREALEHPFKRLGVAVTPEALEVMAAQTDNYPYFIQLIGERVWNEMDAAGRKDVDVELVRRSEERMRKDRDRIHGLTWDWMRHNNLLPYAHRVIDLIERNEGRVSEGAIWDLLDRMSGGKDGAEVRQIYEGLHEDGLIWTDDGETRLGLPSLVSYCKNRGGSSRQPSSGAVPCNRLLDPLAGLSPAEMALAERG